MTAQSQTAQSARFLTGSTMGHVVRMTMTGAAGVTFMFMVDAANLFWVSLLGVEQLMAALGFAWMIQFFSISAGIGMMIGVISTVSRLLGQGRRADARRQTTVSAISAFIMQCLVAGIVIYYRYDLLAFSGATGETAKAAARYLQISMISLPFMALGMVGSAVLRAEGDAWRAMMVTLSAGLVSMIIDPVLIFWMDLGLDGAAYALMISRVLSGLISIYFVIRVHDLAGKIGMADFKQFFPPFALIAVPAILTQLSSPFGNFLITMVVADYGDGAVAGLAVVVRLTVLAFGGLFALSSAIGGIFGQNYGALKFDRVKRTYRDALLFCLIYTLIAWAILALITDFVISSFGLGSEAAEIVRAFTLIAAGGWIFSGALFVANSAFNALGRPIWSTLFNWFRDGVLLWPLTLLMSAGFASSGAIYSQAISSIIVGTAAAYAGWRYVSRLERQARLDRQGAAAYLSAKGDSP